MTSENNKNNVEEKNNEYKPLKGKSFFKKLKYSIVNVEKYPELATEGPGKAVSYIAKLVLVLAIVLTIWTLWQADQMIREGTNYLKESFPDFSYSDGILTVDTQEVFNVDNEQFGKVIVDTNTDEEETINQYLNSINEYGEGVLILKDRAVLKNVGMVGEISYQYKESFDSLNLTQFTKQDVVNYVEGGQINTLYLSLFITLCIYNFSMYFINTLWYAVIISIVGYLTMLILKMRMRFVAVFNMGIYALTLSTVLNIIYVLINIFFDFAIEYFGIMYVTVATIYLLAAIFILKSELIKKQAEVMKIVETEQIVKKEMENKEKEEEPKEEKPESNEKKDKEEKDKKDDEPEGSKA